MANEEQLAILKRGISYWNKWFKANPDESTRIDLSFADLNGVDLSGASLRRVDLIEAKLHGAILDNANLIGANLREADLSKAKLSQANLIQSDFIGANLWGANFFGADLGGATLREADLSYANFAYTNLVGTDLHKANFTRATTEWTIFGNNDLSQTIGLDEVRHTSPSNVDTHTLQRSKGKIPAAFLRGCGLSDFEIEAAKLYNPDLTNHEIDEILYRIHDLRAHQAIQVSPLFISYSHADAAFVDQLEVALNAQGIRFWRDIHDAKSGRLERQIEQAIRHNPTVLLVLSKNAMQSDWVQSEVRQARGLEKELGRDVLCPVALDESWKDGRWPERIMQQVKEYNILDFSQWRNEQVFAPMFARLLDGLQLFYKGTS